MNRTSISSPRSPSSWISGIVRPKSSSPRSNDAGGRKNCLHGLLFKYGPNPVQVAFKTGDFNRQVVFIGGMSEGFLPTEYTEPLSIALEKEKWSLVQVLLSSSYSGYGTSSLEQDAEEINQLIDYLINKENSEGVVLLGHSTGCQANFDCSKAVRGVVLQAPVSDRENFATLPKNAEMIDLALTMIREGRKMELMPREAYPDAPITAYRLFSPWLTKLYQTRLIRKHY